LSVRTSAARGKAHFLEFRMLFARREGKRLRVWEAEGTEEETIDQAFHWQ